MTAKPTRPVASAADLGRAEARAFVLGRLARAEVPIVERDVEMLADSLHVLTEWQRIVAELARESDEPVLGFSVD